MYQNHKYKASKDHRNMQSHMVESTETRANDPSSSSSSSSLCLCFMGSSAADKFSDEPITPIGGFFLQPQMDQIIHCTMGFKNPIDIAAIKSHLKTSLLLSHPRFSSLMVRSPRGLKQWHRTSHVDLNRHIIVVPNTITTASNFDHEAAVNAYLADLSTSSGLSADKPLWEFHLLMAHNCGVFRIHHALGDGASLMSLFSASFRGAEEEEKLPALGSAGKKRNRVNGEKGWWVLLIGFVGMVWFSLIFVVEFALRSLWVCDRKTEISGGDGVELWPRKLATARFKLQDMKLVKKAVPNATINDVLVGVVSAGLSRYLDHRTPNGLPDGLRITGIAMANLREQPRLQELTDLMKSNSGSSWDLHGFFYRTVCNTSFAISNILGPQEEIAVGGNPVTYLRVNTSSLPHALTMHMVSYVERADMQISVAKDIIPDPEFLAKCFEEALLDMKEAAHCETND
ncbi:O-acyltransferase WSD1 isoform X1 [Prunus yedoensis var. nudiflora]|uniref:O-acyltransferase WSD1 isoform X1 n=1 Tax=Prunus yedoensis var. nudiflora TaxID=2094558 RepID=A0A314ZED5_PRUYE|nr:O-acyltransferase WSD1 isoform X1 [Prunus yedoensis var. nudiflora]